MGNCCFKLPIPSHTNNALLDTLEDFHNSNQDWLVLNHDSANTSNNNEGLLTMILTLEENSDLEKTQEFVESNSSILKNILFSKPRRSSSVQPNWSSPEMTRLLQAIGRLPHLEVLLLHEVGTSSNPIPISALQTCLAQVHPRLKQAYLVGHFVGDTNDCTQFAHALKQQPQLQSFALYGNGSREFTLDPILQAVSKLPTLKYLYFHGNMPNALQSSTLNQVGTMPHLETLTIHSCDTNGHNLAALAQCLESSRTLQELTVFEAFEMFQSSHGNCTTALTQLLKTSISLKKVQIWFGFCSDPTVLQPFAHALAANPNITQFETALLWTEYDPATPKVYVDMIQHNTHLTQLHLCGYKGPWRLPLWFYTRLNQTGRTKYVEQSDTMTNHQWIDILTEIPSLSLEEEGEDNASAALEDAPEDEDWFGLSWRYYYLRMHPSLLPTAV